MSEFVTLDGVMEAPGGEPSHPHTGWVFDYTSKEQEQYKLDEIMEADALLLGRVTYEGFSQAWPERSGTFADKMNNMPKYVASTTLQDLEWDNSSVLKGDVADAVAELKQGDGGAILVAGSATLVHSLLSHGLVDELRLMIFPVAVGGGLRVFPDDRSKTSLTLADTKVFSTGVVVHTYRKI